MFPQHSDTYEQEVLFVCHYIVRYNKLCSLTKNTSFSVYTYLTNFTRSLLIICPVKWQVKPHSTLYQNYTLSSESNLLN